MLKVVSRVLPVSFFLFVPFTYSYAMHIMEGFLPLSWSIVWYVVALPFVVYGVIKIDRERKNLPKYLVLLALCGAFAFVLSALKLPSVTGSSSHATGIALGAILFGVFPMSVVGAIILLFQAILLAHGGITTLGANVFSMAIVGSIVAVFVFNTMKKPFGPSVATFFAAFLADLSTYLVTSLELAVAFPEATGGVLASFVKFAGIFAITQVPLGICEGLLSAVIMNILLKYSFKDISLLVGLQKMGSVK